MANPDAVVSRIARLDERGLSVELEDGRRVRLDPSNPRAAGLAAVLDGVNKQRLPVYLEIDAASSTITRLLIPHVSRVASLRAADDGGLDVRLERSHARHLLRRGAPDFAQLEGQLREALKSGGPVVLTEDDAHNIIDVRGYTPGPEGPVYPFPRPPFPPPIPWPWVWIRDLWRRLWAWPWWPWWWFGCISATRAQQVFDAMSATSCDPLTVPVPCIPFLYPDDGCWGRAHEMRRLMVAMGLKPKKVWIEASTWLHVNTKNNPVCYVEWGWHVAPTLCVRGKWFWRARPMVIDPSLFKTPVTKATWKSVQGDPGATLTDSAGSIFYLWGSVTDDTYSETNSVLATYRLQLQNRALMAGPPPYAACP
jgi:glutaminase-like protein